MCWAASFQVVLMLMSTFVSEAAVKMSRKSVKICWIVVEVIRWTVCTAYNQRQNSDNDIVAAFSLTSTCFCSHYRVAFDEVVFDEVKGGWHQSKTAVNSRLEASRVRVRKTRVGDG